MLGKRKLEIDDEEAVPQAMIESVFAFEAEVDCELSAANKILHKDGDTIKDMDVCTELEAKMKEISKLEEMNVFKEVYEDDLPIDCQLISGRWVMTNPEQNVHKARWVMRGFEEHVDPDELFASTSSLASARLLLAVAVEKKLAVYTADVKGAFLNADVPQEQMLYGHAPPEWQPKDLTDGRPVAWKLLKSLYGLRTAPRRWQEHFSKLLCEMGFEQDLLDSCLFNHKIKGIALNVHVDDLLIVGQKKVVEELLKELGTHVELKFGEVKDKPILHLGRTLRKTKSGFEFGISPKYIENMVNEMGWNGMKGSTVLRWTRPDDKKKMKEAEELTEDDEPIDESEVLDKLGQNRFRHAIGKLMWADRPDLKCAVGR